MDGREKLFSAAAALDCLVCPRCARPLVREEENLACSGGHTWNVNRRGTLNVLSVPHRDAYDAALFAARRQVFGAGCYDAVADAVASLLPDGPQRILDAGCGEGWYLNRLLSGRPERTGAGVDISRDAIRLAASQPCTALWCVADLRHMPFSDGAFTCILDILTPAGYAEFRRLLAPGGCVIKVWPAEGYLRELREAKGLPLYRDADVGGWLAQNARIDERLRVTRRLPVDAALWAAFVAMTPLNQDLDAEEKQRLAERPDTHVTVDMNIARCRFD